MTSTSALVPYVFAGYRIRVSTDGHGDAWFVVADACAALSVSPMLWAMAHRREGDHCLYVEENPGSGGLTLALIHEAALLRRLQESGSARAHPMRRWLTHALLPALQRCHGSTGVLPLRTIEAVRRETAAAVIREADETVHLTGLSQAEALLAALERILDKGGQDKASDPPLQDACAAAREVLPTQGAHPERDARPGQFPMPLELGRRLLAASPSMAWLTADQLSDRLDGTLRCTNQQLAAKGLQLRSEEDEWQLTAAGHDWAVALPLWHCGEWRQQILWDPAVVALLQGAT